MSQISIQYMPLSELRVADRNPKMHSGMVLDESIERFGYVQPITLNEATGKLVAGHGRLESLSRRKAAGAPPPERVELREDGEWLIPVVRGISFADEREAQAYLLADNRISEIGGWNYVDLDSTLKEIGNLTGSGFSEAEMRDINAKAEIILLSSAIHPDEAQSAQVPILENPMNEKADSKPGEIYELGPHKIICGDCRNPDHWERLLGDENQKAQVVVTSPPYAQQREYDGKSGFIPIPPDAYVDWWKALNDLIVQYLEPDGCFFLNIKEHCENYQRVLYVFDLVIAHVRQWGWYFVDTFAWTHGGTPRRVDNRFKNSWEPIYQFVRSPKFKFKPEYVRKRVAGPLPESLWQGGHPNDEDKQGDSEAMERHVLEATKRRLQKGSNSALQGQPDNVTGIREAVARSQIRAGNRASIPNPRLDTQQGTPRAGELLVARIEESMEGGFAYPSNVLSLGRNREALGHTAAFPIKLPDFFIRAYSEEGDLIVDPFLGSGSTLIAAEVRHRVCYGFEISPLYCDVIRKRYENYKRGNPQESLALALPEEVEDDS